MCGDRATARIRAYLQFLVFDVCFARSAFSRAGDMRRIDLVSATLAGWARLNPQQRERFLEAGLKAALRLDRQGFRSLAAAAGQDRRPSPLRSIWRRLRFRIGDMAALLGRADRRATDTPARGAG